MVREHDERVPEEELADVHVEPDDELGDVAAAKTKQKKLKDELEQIKKERLEYLDGWQRCKAEMVNSKREASEMLAKAKDRGREFFVEELIPALDGFDAAMQGDAWLQVDGAWRTGISSIKSHIEAILRAHGVEIFGVAGEAFDPSIHEPLEERDGGPSHTVAQVFRRGYKTRERVLRAAQVSIFK